MIVEQWKPVVGYEGLYEVSNKGRVRSRYRVLRPNILSCGTRVVCLHLNGQKCVTVAKLMYEAFIGPVTPGLVVSYENKNREDLRPGNLVLCTRSETRCRYSDATQITERKRQRVMQLYDAGYEPIEIAHSTELSLSSVYRIRKQAAHRSRMTTAEA